MGTNNAVPVLPLAAESELNISLENHLQEALKPLVQLLSEPLRSQLHTALSKAELDTDKISDFGNKKVVSTPVITHVLLSSISAWSRSQEGLAALRSCSPPLQPSDYSMIALLAGSRSAPDRNFPTDFAPLNYDETLLRTEMNDRRAVTALINALLSIIGSGVATWWAAERLGWQNEWVSLYLKTPINISTLLTNVAESFICIASCIGSSYRRSGAIPDLESPKIAS
jgi:predicted RNA-binding Zn ribbon-like protein